MWNDKECWNDQLSVKYRQECARVDPRGGDTPSNGLRKEAPPERDAFYRL